MNDGLTGLRKDEAAAITDGLSEIAERNQIQTDRILGLIGEIAERNRQIPERRELGEDDSERPDSRVGLEKADFSDVFDDTRICFGFG